MLMVKAYSSSSDSRTFWLCPRCNQSFAFFKVQPGRCESCNEKLPSIKRLIRSMNVRVFYHMRWEGMRNDKN